MHSAATQADQYQRQLPLGSNLKSYRALSSASSCWALALAASTAPACVVSAHHGLKLCFLAHPLEQQVRFFTEVLRVEGRQGLSASASAASIPPTRHLPGTCMGVLKWA